MYRRSFYLALKALLPALALADHSGGGGVDVLGKPQVMQTTPVSSPHRTWGSLPQLRDLDLLSPSMTSYSWDGNSKPNSPLSGNRGSLHLLLSSSRQSYGGNNEASAFCFPASAEDRTTFQEVGYAAYTPGDSERSVASSEKIRNRPGTPRYPSLKQATHARQDAWTGPFPPTLYDEASESEGVFSAGEHSDSNQLEAFVSGDLNGACSADLFKREESWDVPALVEAIRSFSRAKGLDIAYWGSIDEGQGGSALRRELQGHLHTLFNQYRHVAEGVVNQADRQVADLLAQMQHSNAGQACLLTDLRERFGRMGSLLVLAMQEATPEEQEAT